MYWVCNKVQDYVLLYICCLLLAYGGKNYELHMPRIIKFNIWAQVGDSWECHVKQHLLFGIELFYEHILVVARI